MVNFNRESKKNTHPLSGVRVPYGMNAICCIFSMYCIVGFISAANLLIFPDIRKKILSVPQYFLFITTSSARMV